jgi:ubiquinone/menaquinone biosynthesis C-methylase UbiE
MGYRVSEQEVRFYDVMVPDWPGEIEFYRALAADVKERGGSVLEVACGTGRVALRLARDGVSMVGMDYSPDMLVAARRKSQDLSNVRWVEGDMQSFALGEVFDLVIIPGHSFQYMLTPQAQGDCLSCIRRHLKTGGKLVVHLDHQDLDWLGDLCLGRGTGFEEWREYWIEEQAVSVRAASAWSYERATQTASVVTVWEFRGKDGTLIERKENARKDLHCVFRFEMEHLLARAGFAVDAVYGDFYRCELKNDSSEMIWAAH